MTLFAFFWAALLPHHPVIVHGSQSLALLAASLNSAELTVDLDRMASRPYSPLHLQASLSNPLELRPQLFWPEVAAVDWQQWSAAAAVAVVPESDDAHRTSGTAHISLPAGACASYDTAASGEPNADGFTVQVKDMAIGQVPSRQAAERVANQLREAVPLLEANPGGLTPSLGAAQAAGQIDGQTVFVLPDAPQSSDAPDGKGAALKATQWVNNLRRAFGAESLDASQVQMVAYGLGETHQTLGGTASWYGPYFHGRQTATGETFNQHDLTAAHKTLPFGTYLKVRNQLNGKTVVVRINDRGPYIGDRSLDLSYAAAQCLGGDHVGVIPYQATILAPGFPYAWRQDVVAALP